VPLPAQHTECGVQRRSTRGELKKNRATNREVRGASLLRAPKRTPLDQRPEIASIAGRTTVSVTAFTALSAPAATDFSAPFTVFFLLDFRPERFRAPEVLRAALRAPRPFDFRDDDALRAFFAVRFRATLRPPLRALRATLRPALRALRATLRPALRALRATLRPVLRALRAPLRALFLAAFATVPVRLRRRTALADFPAFFARAISFSPCAVADIPFPPGRAASQIELHLRCAYETGECTRRCIQVGAASHRRKIFVSDCQNASSFFDFFLRAHLIGHAKLGINAPRTVH
jgi:hypothetical protein